MSDGIRILVWICSVQAEDDIIVVITIQIVFFKAGSYIVRDVGKIGINLNGFAVNIQIPSVGFEFIDGQVFCIGVDLLVTIIV